MEANVVERDPASESVEKYEAPCIETVLTSDDVERESLYGGISQT